MKTLPRQCLLLLTLITTVCLLSGCGTTRSENGVTIESQGSYNPLNYIPGL